MEASPELTRGVVWTLLRRIEKLELDLAEKTTECEGWEGQASWMEEKLLELDQEEDPETLRQMVAAVLVDLGWSEGGEDLESDRATFS